MFLPNQMILLHSCVLKLFHIKCCSLGTDVVEHAALVLLHTSCSPCLCVALGLVLPPLNTVRAENFNGH
jgi:hypothetical protein